MASSAPPSAYFPNSVDEADNRTYREEQYAAFGQIDYDLTARLHAGLGARYATSREDYNSTEFEASYRPITGLKFGLRGSAEHAVVTNTKNPLTVGLGEHLIDVPNGTYTASVSYNCPVSDRWNLRARSDYAWVGHSYGSYQSTNPNYFNPSYGVLNASFVLGTDRTEFSVYAKNLNNDQKIIQTPEVNTVVEGYTVRPRTIGLTVRYWFF